jgi:hypothetical protein
LDNGVLRFPNPLYNGVKAAVIRKQPCILLRFPFKPRAAERIVEERAAARQRKWEYLATRRGRR